MNRSILSNTRTLATSERLKTRSNAMKPYNLAWYRLLRSIIGFLVRLLCHLEVTGTEHMPLEGPVLMVTNHLHWLDPPILMVAIPQREITVLAASKFREKPISGWLFTLVGAIFVRREEFDRQALHQCLAALAEGAALGLSPEGTRSQTGALQRARTGAAYIACKSGALVVPVVCYGQEETEAAWLRLRRPHIRIVMGEPFNLPPLEGPAKAQQLAAHTDTIMRRMAALLPERYRGPYA
jgi:1-acyl-sn-glycerol-3-phosphate acyltransferase